jgi:hypothetical protein
MLFLAVVVQVACGYDKESEEEKDEDKPKRHLVKAGTKWHGVPSSCGIFVKKIVDGIANNFADGSLLVNGLPQKTFIYCALAAGNGAAAFPLDR